MSPSRQRPASPAVLLHQSTSIGNLGHGGLMEHGALTGTGLRDLGWTADRAAAFKPHAAAGLVPGRVVSSGGSTIVATAEGHRPIALQRRFRREALSPADLPVVGDWLALEPGPGTADVMALRHVLPRAGIVGRHRSSDGQPQILAANVDLALLVSGLDHDLNLRRIERYLVMALDGRVAPVVILNKMDIAIDLDRAVADVHGIAPGTRVIVMSALTGVGMDELRTVISPRITACLLGSSGVGKSTITNVLLGEAQQAVKQVREDDSQGRHTTTRRELFRLTGGGLLIDTPGLRTVGVLEDEAGLAATFAEVESLARQCRFADCRHDTEPGCAVREAIEAGVLRADRLASHQKLEAERRWMVERSDERVRREAERKTGRLYRRAGKLADRYKRGGA